MQSPDRRHLSYTRVYDFLIATYSRYPNRNDGGIARSSYFNTVFFFPSSYYSPVVITDFPLKLFEDSDFVFVNIIKELYHIDAILIFC